MSPNNKYTLPDEFRFELSDFLANAWKHRYAVLALVLVFTGAVTVGAMRLPKEYEATARLLIDPVLPRVLNESSAVENLAEQSRQEKAFYLTQQKIIASRSVLHDTIQRLSLAQNTAFASATGIQPKPTVRQLERQLRTMLSVQLDSGGRIVNVTIRSKDPNLAQEIANAIGQAYIDHTLERRLETTRGAARWLDQQVDTFANRLETLESQLNDFRQDKLLISVSLEDRQNMIAANLSMLNERILQTRSALIKLRAQRETIEDHLEASPADDLAPPPLLDNEVTTDLRSQLADLRKQRAKASSRYGAKHPMMRGLDEQLTETKLAFASEVRGRLINLDAEIDALETTHDRFEAEMLAEKEKALALNGLGLEYNKLTREVGTTKDTYESLLKRRTETALSGLLESNFVSWFEKAEPPQAPVSPVVPLYALAGLATAVTLSLSFVGLLTFLDNTIRSRTQLEELLALPILGSFPPVLPTDKQDDSLGVRDLFVYQNPTSSAAEAARFVRTNILLLTTDSPSRALMVTSPRAQEGKTTTALALAISMAQAGNRVLVVDTDLRRPRLHRTLGVSSRTGLTTLLLDGNPAEAIKSTQIERVDLLPCGPLPPNPAEILHSDRFKTLVESLRSSYDRVIFDSPPVNYVTDASILSRLVDGVILVVRANSTPREAARAAARQLLSLGANLHGVVLNSSDSTGIYQEYRYSYTQHDQDDIHDHQVTSSAPPT